MKNKILKYLLLSSCLMLVFSACRKDSFKGTETGSSGKTFVWITEAQTHVQFFSPFTAVTPVTLFSVRRDAANSGDLKKPVDISLVALDTAAINKYNTANGTNYTQLPSNIYTFSTDPSITSTASSSVFHFGPGDFAKNLTINLDGSKMDLSKQYVAAYTISNAGGFTKKSGYDTVYSVVAIKNQYDGVYSVAGTIYRDADVVLGGPYAANVTFSLATQSATDVAFDLLWAPGTSQVGGVNPINLHVDPATNKVTATSAVNATLMNIPGADNYYDPAAKAFHLNFVWNGTDPSHRSVSIVLTYAAPR
jgi:hypothetical protein